MHRGLGREKPARQHIRSVLAVPFLPLSEVHLQAIEAGEVPRWAREWHTYFLVDCPDIPIHTVALPVRRADGIKGGIERVTITGKPRRVVLATDGKGDRAGGKIEQVTVNGGIVYGQLILA